MRDATSKWKRIAIIVAAAAIVVCCGPAGFEEHNSGADSGPDGDTDTETGTDTGTGTDSDLDSGGGPDGGSDTDGDTDSDTGSETGLECDADWGWYDEATGLCWQNPVGSEPYTWDEAMSYCDGLVQGGCDDWRMPMIQELISLERGCVDSMPTGDLSPSECGVTDPDCLGYMCWDVSCGVCEDLAGPDDDPMGCYWIPELAGDCSIAWSSSLTGDDYIDTLKYYVNFSNGYVNYYNETYVLQVRCVRGGPWY